MVFANSTAILTDAFPPNQCGTALGVNQVAAIAGSFESTPLWAGIDLLPLTIGFLVAGPLSGWLSDRYGTRVFSLGGQLVVAALSIGVLQPDDRRAGGHPCVHIDRWAADPGPARPDRGAPSLPPANASALTGDQFFPQLISGPFHSGLIVVFGVAASMSLLSPACCGRRRPWPPLLLLCIAGCRCAVPSRPCRSM